MNTCLAFDAYYRPIARPIAFDALDGTYHVITPNTQQSQLLMDAIVQSRSDTCALPNVISFNQWLERCYLFSSGDGLTPISAYQQLLHWHHVITATAQSMSSTHHWQLAQQYQSQYQQDARRGVPSTLSADPHYRQCYHAYRDELAHHGLIDHVTLARDAQDLITIPADQRMVFCGFDALAIPLKKIIESVPASQLFCFLPNHQSTTPTISTVDHERQQRDYLIEYCQAHLRDPTSGSLGLIVAQSSDDPRLLDPIRQLLQRSHGQSDAYHISSAISSSLASQPMARILIELLDFFAEPSNVRCIKLLQSPVLQHPDIPSSAYHMFCQSLQDIALSHWPKHAHFSQHAPDPIDRIASHCRHLMTAVTQPSGTWLFWQTWFKDTLQSLFKHYRATSPDAHDVLRQCLHAIREQPCPPSLPPSISYQAWLEATKRYLDRCLYRPRALSRIRVLTWSQALDIPHDQLIVLSHHADHWPPRSHEQGTTDTSSFWQHILRQLAQHCRRLRFIRLAFDDQQQPLLPVAATAHLPNEHIPINHAHSSADLAEQCVQMPVAAYGKAIADDERSISTAVIDAYSQCHAQGFIQHRLHIRQPLSNQYGVTSADIGTLIHEALAAIDNVCSDQLPDQEVIDDAISDLLQRHRCCRYLTDGQRVILQTHITRVLNEWLAYRLEAHQSDSITHSQHEVALEQTLFGVQFNVRVDRIDYYADGQCRIIDYKTGMTNRASWLQDPPQSLQMIIYALCFPKTTAIAFASLHPDQFGYSGYGSGNDLPGIKPLSEILLSDDMDHEKTYNSWPIQRALWEKSIGRLVTHYRDGAMHKNPIQGVTTCQYCQLQSACRLYETPSTERLS